MLYKKIILVSVSILTGFTGFTYGAITAITGGCPAINDGTGCASCFKEETKLYTCNPHQSSCQKDQASGLTDIAINPVGNTDNYIIMDDNMGDINFSNLQSQITWSMQSAVANMFEAPASYFTAPTAPGECGWQKFSQLNNKDGYLLKPGCQTTWTAMKNTGWLRPDVATVGAQRNSPAYRIAYTPNFYTSATEFTPHRQCVYYYVRFCGDGILDDGTNGNTDKGEKCDDGNMTNGDGCSTTCQTETVSSSCTSLTVDPVSATVTGGGNVTLTCAGSGTITSYSIVVKKPDGTTLQTLPSASGIVNIPTTPIGSYTATCFINGQNTTNLPACQKTITNTATVNPLCTSLTGVPSTLTTDESFTFSCHSSPAQAGTNYSITGITPTITGTSATGTYTNTSRFTTAGSYTVSCRVNNDAQVPACQKTVTVTVPTIPYITIDKRDANSNDLDGMVGNDTQTVNSGDNAIFKIRVTNNGTEDLKNITLSDTVAPNCAGSVTLGSTPTKPSTWGNFTTGGSGNHSDTLLQQGEYFEYTCSKGNTLDDYTNIAVVNAVGNISNTPVSASNPTQVLLVPICNSLTLTPPTTSTTNSIIGFTCDAYRATSYRITKDGAYFGESASGTMSFNTPGKYTIGCYINGTVSTPPACIKEITITTPPPNPIPSIFIDKDDSTPGTPDDDGNDIQRVQNNGTATFTVRFTNNGNEALKNVVITDQYASDCNRSSSQTASLYAGGTTANFDVSETFSYQCTKTNVTSSTFPNNRNTASITGVGVTSSQNVADSDITEIFTKQSNPNIMIEKNDNDNRDDEQEIDEDETAEFSVKVTNNGNESLENLRISDELTSDCEKDTSETRRLIENIGDHDSIFDPGETFNYTCEESGVTSDTFPDETNTVCVEGRGVDTDQDVDDCDDTNITINQINQPSVCEYIESSEGSFGGAPFRTGITCQTSDSSSTCQIEVSRDGDIINTYDDCTRVITFSTPGDYSVACIVDDERSSECEMGITVEAMTDIPTGTKILIVTLLSFVFSGLGTYIYVRKRKFS